MPLMQPVRPTCRPSPPTHPLPPAFLLPTWMLSLPQAAARERPRVSSAPLEQAYATCMPAPAGGKNVCRGLAAGGDSPVALRLACAPHAVVKATDNPR